MSVLQDFKKFAMRGNVIDLAVGVIIGAAFSKIVDSMVKDVVMPLVNFIIGGQVDFTNKFLVLRDAPNYTGPYTYDALTKAGATVFAYGNFVTILINFILLAFIIFWMVRLINKAKHQEPAAPKVTPEDILLLREIRDELKKVSPAPTVVPSTTSPAVPPKP